MCNQICGLGSVNRCDYLRAEGGHFVLRQVDGGGQESTKHAGSLAMEDKFRDPSWSACYVSHGVKWEGDVNTLYWYFECVNQGHLNETHGFRRAKVSPCTINITQVPFRLH